MVNNVEQQAKKSREAAKPQNKRWRRGQDPWLRIIRRRRSIGDQGKCSDQSGTRLSLVSRTAHLFGVRTAHSSWHQANIFDSATRL